MKVLLSWLHDVLGAKPSAVEVRDALTSVGIEVGETRHLGAGLEKVLVGQIEATKPHPNADRLTLCEVSIGSEKLGIVCGARNMKTGDKVAVGMIGAKLPNGMELKKSKIRGEPSDGMLCSESELGFRDESEGILILPETAVLGEPLSKAMGRDDWTLELELTPNRGDCLGLLGVAREVAAALNLSSRVSSSSAEGPAESTLRAIVQDGTGCPRYSLRLIEGIHVGPSPAWLKNRLEACGVRSISNVVDVTNYVMMEWGQPLHAFDRDRVTGAVEVRRARAGEKLLCLDDVERVLTADDLVIADETGPIALAGIIGGKPTSVTEKTKAILLESAHFDPKTVRVTARRLGLHTESSHRFERWVDPSAVWGASTRAVEIFAEVASGKVIQGIDCRVGSFGPRRLVLRQTLLRRILGTEIKTAGEYLARLGLSVEKREEGWQVEVPPRRRDLEREIDLVEEVARIHGYQNISTELPPLDSEPEADELKNKVYRLKEFCRSAGLSEAVTYSFASSDNPLAVTPSLDGDPIALANPLTPETRQLRRSLLPNLLEVWKTNRNRQIRGIGIFEVGRLFAKPESADSFPAREALHLGVLLAQEIQGKTWQSDSRNADFFDGRGAVEFLAREMGWGGIAFEAGKAPDHFHPGKSASLLFQGRVVGAVGELHPSLLKSEESGALVFVDLCLDPLLGSVRRPIRFQPLSSFPVVKRDLAFILSKKTAAQEISSEIKKLRDPLLQHLVLFDVYDGKGMPAESRSLAFSLTFGASDRTLTEAEVEASVNAVVDRVTKSFSATLRR